jgi:hypothetical protein
VFMSTAVMPGLVPGIHVLLGGDKDVDGRDKPGHDVERFSYRHKSRSAQAHRRSVVEEERDERCLRFPPARSVAGTARAVAEALKPDGGAVQVVGVGALDLDLGNLADP